MRQGDKWVCNLAWILTGFLVISGVIGIFWAPRNEGKSLEELESARQRI
jgi:inositol transporter-like SP family MFS transporter